MVQKSTFPRPVYPSPRRPGRTKNRGKTKGTRKEKVIYPTDEQPEGEQEYHNEEDEAEGDFLPQTVIIKDDRLAKWKNQGGNILHGNVKKERGIKMKQEGMNINARPSVTHGNLKQKESVKPKPKRKDRGSREAREERIVSMVEKVHKRITEEWEKYLTERIYSTTHHARGRATWRNKPSHPSTFSPPTPQAPEEEVIVPLSHSITSTLPTPLPRHSHTIHISDNFKAEFRALSWVPKFSLDDLQNRKMTEEFREEVRGRDIVLRQIELDMNDTHKNLRFLLGLSDPSSFGLSLSSLITTLLNYRFPNPHQTADYTSPKFRSSIPKQKPFRTDEEFFMAVQEKVTLHGNGIAWGGVSFKDENELVFFIGEVQNRLEPGCCFIQKALLDILQNPSLVLQLQTAAQIEQQKRTIIRFPPNHPAAPNWNNMYKDYSDPNFDPSSDESETELDDLDKVEEPPWGWSDFDDVCVVCFGFGCDLHKDINQPLIKSRRRSRKNILKGKGSPSLFIPRSDSIFKMSDDDATAFVQETVQLVENWEPGSTENHHHVNGIGGKRKVPTEEEIEDIQNLTMNLPGLDSGVLYSLFPQVKKKNIQGMFPSDNNNLMPDHRVSETSWWDKLSPSQKRTARTFQQNMEIRPYEARDGQEGLEQPTFYTPCKHPPGVTECSEENECLCVDEERYCEKWCLCDEKCQRRYRGCNCEKGCQTKACPCWMKKRECDPDLCKRCYNKCCNKGFHEERQLATFVGPSAPGTGWGLFLGENLKHKGFVGSYTGEMVDEFENARRDVLDGIRRVCYGYEASHKRSIDAIDYGNELRFINHNPSPNCDARMVASGGVHRVGIFRREINQRTRVLRAGTELFLDYGPLYPSSLLGASSSTENEDSEDEPEGKKIQGRTSSHTPSDRFDFEPLPDYDDMNDEDYFDGVEMED